MQNYGGVSRYYSTLMDRLDRNGVLFDLPSMYSSNHYANALAVSYPGKVRVKDIRNMHIRKIFFRYIKYHNRKQSQRLLIKRDFDIFHPTYYDPYFLKSALVTNRWSLQFMT